MMAKTQGSLFSDAHIKAVAKVLHGLQPEHGGEADMRDKTISSFAALFEKYNPAFDRQTFLKACG